MIEPWWETCYRNLYVQTFGEPSSEVIRLTQTLPCGASVLDIGCDDGRNAPFLSRHGMQVDAFDISESGIVKLKNTAADQGLKINTWVQDVRTFRPSVTYDVVICHGVLHFLERPEWLQVLHRIKSWTRYRGVNVVAVFTDKLPIPDDLAYHVKGLFREGELLQLYSDL
jgi:tellurite methyltransferase